ncbi:efflux RND transporter periplasmic adaptor subunit [Burkholderia sp. 22PA0099]|uniref:efflux RND transporter periplasmic adaptor subunit n=1 Tax=Burkholderia sp. 22PA0099 TaxID=3237372 RepID=UPI0039C171AB
MNDHSTRKREVKGWILSGAALAVIAAAVLGGPRVLGGNAGAAGAAPVPSVVVARPLQREIDSRVEFQGRLSAIEQVELRAQVGGTLTRIGFKDGSLVRKGDVLFEIDRTPYEIKLNEAIARLDAARARLTLANRQFGRAQTLQQSGAGTTENAEQRDADQRAAKAAVDDAQAELNDARFDLDHCRIVAPFTGRIGTHLVSVGNLISGSRAGSSPTTLLATLVSVNPVHLDFDMSEADYMAFSRRRLTQPGPLANAVQISLSDEQGFGRHGALDFLDNAIDRSSGTIHARATLANDDLLLTPGGFARVRVQLAPPSPALLVPDASVLPDQSEHIVLVVGGDDIVKPRRVRIGDLRGGLRVILGGLQATDRVIVAGMPAASPGAKVSPHAGAIDDTTEQGGS